MKASVKNDLLPFKPSPFKAPPAPGLLLRPDHPGEGFLSSEDWSRIAAQFSLTGRELGVAMLMFEGKSRFQIAHALHCAAGTIRVYIDRLFAKLNVTDRLEMALRVVRAHLALQDGAIVSPSHKSATC